MATFSRAIRRLDDVIDETERIRKRAQSDGLDDTLVRKLRQLEDELETLKRELRSLKRDFDQ